MNDAQQGRHAQLDAHRFGPWAVVTGASSGIGREMARQLAANGLNLVLVSRRGEVLRRVGEDLRTSHGIDYRVIEADLSLEDAPARVAAETDDLDVGLLVSNAGTGSPGRFLSFEQEDLKTISQLNGVSSMMLTHLFGRRLARRGRGGVLLVSALGTDTGIPFHAKAAASKALVTTLGRSLHHEFRQIGVNISVLVVTPTETPIIEKMGLSLADMPMKPMAVDKCVRAGLEGLKANRMVVVPGLFYRIMTTLMPAGLVRAMTASMMRKSRNFVA